MHEITLCTRIVEILEQHACLHNARRVTAVWVEAGACACIEPSALEFCFDVVCQGTRMEGCMLNFRVKKAACWCRDCERNVTLPVISVLICPVCMGRNVLVEADEGMEIKRMEFE